MSNSRPSENLLSPDSREQAASGSSPCIKPLAASCHTHEASDNIACQSHALPGSAERTDAYDGGTQRLSTTYHPASHAEQSAVEADIPEGHNLPDASSPPRSTPSRPQPIVHHDTPGSKLMGGDVGVTTAGCSSHPAGQEYRSDDALGALRRKPGRGEPTTSLSCSDKLARWGMLGLQARTY